MEATYEGEPSGSMGLPPFLWQPMLRARISSLSVDTHEENIHQVVIESPLNNPFMLNTNVEDTECAESLKPVVRKRETLKLGPGQALVEGNHLKGSFHELMERRSYNP
ncbi:hypothetical protein JRQ81_003351 [Phrynocephalus forsythii]|uniref:Uncharacterized protein n=1 Tax=Phrynocephalus forsythii TaxID=171643 RepID=A0A9Q1AXC9_9SAUR|nr:hypothetical protein JRQ81_003351 [Phrynocephalus forsythii]